MSSSVRTGLLIGIGTVVWTFVMGFTGWYKDPALTYAFFLVIAIEIAGLIWGLRKTAAQGRAYGGQVLAGTMMAIVAGVVIIGSSLLFTMVAFPDYFRELEAMQRQMLAAEGKTAAEIDAAVRAGAASTPMAQAMSGFIGTLITGIVASAIIALVVRAPKAAAARV